MDTAKRLQVELGSWLRVREEVVRKLKALAKQAEDLYQSGTGGQSFFRVLLWLDNGATTRSMVEKLMSSKTMEDLKSIIIKDIAKEGEIKILWRKLESECAGILLHAKGPEKAFPRRHAVRDLENLLKELANKKPNELSKVLEEKAAAMARGTREMEDMKNLMNKEIAEMSQLQKSVENLGNSNKEGENIDPSMKPWLDDLQKDPSFANTVCYFYFCIKRALGKKHLSTLSDKLDIVLVAHGGITQEFIPAGHLMPLSSVEDVMFYSPWNCTIDSTIIYHIAMGDIQPKDRKFSPDPEISALPQHWNRLKRRESKQMEIPKIMLSPVNYFEEQPNGANGRIVVPYVARHSTSFQNVTLALGVALQTLGRRATLHLATCLSYEDVQETDPFYRKCSSQYAITPKKTYMIYQCPTGTGIDVNNPLFRAIQECSKRETNPLIDYLEYEMIRLALMSDALLLALMMKEIKKNNK